MGVQKIAWVQCDGCGDSLMGETEDVQTAADAREIARMFGFHTGLSQGRDLCSTCWEAGKR